MRAVRLSVLAVSVALLGGFAVYAQTRPAEPQRPSVQMRRMGFGGSVIGVRLADVTAEQVKTLKLTKAEGAIVESVNPESPASAAGLRVNDVIVEYDGEHVRSARQLSRLVEETPTGREVVAGVMRDGKRIDVRLKPEAASWLDPRLGGMIDSDQMRDLGEEVGRAAREMSRNFPDVMGGARGRARLGVSVQELTPELAEYFGVKSGVLVASIEKGSVGEKAGLKAGDVITAVDGRSVTSRATLVSALPSDSSPHDVNLKVTRDKKELTLKATLEPVTPTTSERRRGERA